MALLTMALLTVALLAMALLTISLLTMALLTMQMLDELLADTLCRHALRLSRRQSRVSDSRVLGAAHRQLANRAMLDELLTQLQVDPLH